MSILTASSLWRLPIFIMKLSRERISRKKIIMQEEMQNNTRVLQLWWNPQ